MIRNVIHSYIAIIHKNIIVIIVIVIIKIGAKKMRRKCEKNLKN